MTDEIVTVVQDEGLGNSAHLVDLGDGRALAVDPCRDLRALRRVADARRLRIAFAADTHLHADFLSGAVQLTATDGAEVFASRPGRRAFPHTGLEDGDEVDLGGLSLRAIATPGHTGEHLAYLLLDGDRTLGVFTGGSLLAGSAARTDLVDPSRTEEFARAQYRSLRRLADLSDDVAVWPTHGAGTFCAVGPREPGSTATIGSERATNPMLNAPDEDAFVQLMLESLGSYPAYFRRLPEQNRRGPAVLPAMLDLVAVPPDPQSLVVDVRPIESYAACHPTGALSIPLRPAFASWLGWLAPDDRPLLLLRDADQDPQEVLWQAAKVGYTNIHGEIVGGIDAWREAGLPTSSIPLREAFRSDGVRLLDIRQRSEYQAGHARGALNVELGDLTDRLADLTDVPTVVMCSHGARAMGAASILERAGFENVTVLAGGPGNWTAANPRGGESAS